MYWGQEANMYPGLAWVKKVLRRRWQTARAEGDGCGSKVLLFIIHFVVHLRLLPIHPVTPVTLLLILGLREGLTERTRLIIGSNVLSTECLCLHLKRYQQCLGLRELRELVGEEPFHLCERSTA